MTEPPEDVLSEVRQMLERFQKQGTDESPRTVPRRSPGCGFRVHYLISFSMPEERIAELLEEAVRINRSCGRERVSVAVRGFVKGDLRETLRVLARISRKVDADLPMYLDPEIFRKYGVEMVPLIVASGGDAESLVVGDSSISYALDVLERYPGERVRAGRTYPVSEEDFERMLERKLKTVRMRTPQPDPEVSFPVTKVREERVYFVDPSYRVPEDIRAPDGRVVVKRDTVINPADFVPLGRYAVIDGTDEREIRFALRLKPRKIILARGNPLKLSRKYGVPFYAACPELMETLRISRTPVIFEGEGRLIKVTEKKLD